MANYATALVDTSAIRHNVGVLRGRASGAQVMAAVKADAYGHGLIPCARAAVAGGASWLAVAHAPDALALRAAGIDVRILALIGTPGQVHEEAIRADVDLSAGAPWLIEEIAQAAATAGRAARVHLEADTGLSRGGQPEDHWTELLDAALKAEADGHVSVVGLWSHLACADEPGHPSIRLQQEAFTRFLEVAEGAGARPEVRHLANSAALLTLPDAHYDLVRPGIAVYGIPPVPGDFGLRPAMTLRSRLALAKRVPAGEGVSYGHRYVTAAETTLGLVPVGYADGVPRHGTNRIEVWAAGARRRIAGTVCMDQFMIDVGDDVVAAGDEVVLFGAGDHGEPTAADWAEAIGTIPYEIVTRVGPRVARAYI